MTRIIRRALAILVAVVLTSALVGSAFYRPSLEGGLHLVERFSVGEWLRDLPSNLPWVLLFALFTAAIAPLRAWRWGYTLPRPGPGYVDRYHAVAIGLLANNVVPGKLGEPVRALALSRFASKRGVCLPFVQSLGTIVVCKLLDLVALAGLVGLAPRGPFQQSAALSDSWTSALIALPLLLGAVLALARWAPKLADCLRRRRKAHRLELALRELSIGLAASGSAWSIAKALMATTIAVATVSLGYSIALRGSGVQAGIFSGVVMLGVITVGQAPPGVPAGLGMYYLSCSWAARALGATAEQAASIAVLTHLTTVFTHASIGLVTLLVRRVRIRDFVPRRGRATVEREVEAAARATA